jgi:uncharacterized membrane protein
METILIVLGLVVLAFPVFAVVALVKVYSLESKLRKLTRQFEERVVQGLTPQPAAQPAAASTVWQQTVSVPEPVVEEQAAIEPDPAPVEEEQATALPPPQTSPPVRNVEQALASRWLVWLGGAAIALGGLLLIKYAHDQGLVPPIVRVLVGLTAGAALIWAGEWIRLRRGEDVKDFVPAALAAAGLIVAFGVTYAAYALYDLVAPAMCFPLLALISLFALWLSLRQGPLIAALGLVGATVTPALISTENPSAAGFFAYLLVIVVASLALLRKRAWWWLGYAATAVGTAWALMWILGSGAGASVAIGVFGLAIGAAAVLVPRGLGILDESHGSLWNTKTLSPAMGVAIAGCVAGGAILSALVVQSGHAPTALMFFAAGMLAITAFGWFRNGLVAAPLLAALVTFLVLAAWREVGFHTWAFDERGFWVTVPGLIEPPRFRNAMLLAGLLFSLIGAAGVFRKSETRPWAVLAAASSFAFLFVAWGRSDFTLTWMMWAGLAVAFAAVLKGCILKLRPFTDDHSAARSIEVLVGGVVLLLLFALDRGLDGVWLTLAIAALAAALAFVTRQLPLPNIGGIAAAVAGFAALRLFVGREFWGEPEGLPLGAHWVLYGYGVPAALFWQASRWLRAPGFERWRVAFEGVSLGLLISLVSLEIRVLIGGGITNDNLGLLELGAHACAWLGAAYGLAYRQQLYSSFISKWGAWALLGASSLAFLGALTVRNPVLTGDAVEGGQVFNALWLAYLVPVPIYALMARKLEGLGLGKLRSALGVFTLVLLMAFVTLLVKRQFQDETIDIEFLSQAESYAVSLAWLVTGIGIFIAGIRLGRQTIRYGGLAVLVLTVLKVFGYDLFSLGGLWRIASMIGLGLCLVGVGWLYTRYIGGKEKLVSAAEV